MEDRQLDLDRSGSNTRSLRLPGKGAQSRNQTGCGGLCAGGTAEPMTDTMQASLSDEGRYRLLVDAVTDYAIYMLDPDGHRRQLESGRGALQGLSTPARSSAQHFSRFYTEEDRAPGPARAGAGDSPGTEGRFESEGWRVRKDGSRFWAHVVIDPIRDRAGTLSASPRSPAT